jgi:hypothetical protein
VRQSRWPFPSYPSVLCDDENLRDVLSIGKVDLRVNAKGILAARNFQFLLKGKFILTLL